MIKHVVAFVLLDLFHIKISVHSTCL